MRRPLYVLSAGELWQKVEGLERRQRGALELAERWTPCCCLTRVMCFCRSGLFGAGGMWDLARNEVVAVFLRWVMLA